PSTYYYLEDKKSDHPWITKLPFAVQCVSNVEVIDCITRTRFTNQYKYHHGYYDYEEREFRGFGMVEQTDTDSFENYVTGIDTNGIQTIEQQFYQSPVLTKSWFHTGAFLNNDKILTQFVTEYFKNPALPEYQLVEPALPDSLSIQEWREALRACKGTPLRVEIYALDGTELENIPYRTAQHSCLIKLVQPLRQDQPIFENKHAVFFVHESETITYYYERNAADPRIAHTINVQIDEFGNIAESVVIGYGRKTVDPALTDQQDQDKQSEIHVTYTVNNYTNKVDVDDLNYRLPILCEAQTYELTGFKPGGNGFFQLKKIGDDFNDQINTIEINYEDAPPDTNQHKRLVEHIRHLFLKDDLGSALPPGMIESLALPFESYELAFTKSLAFKVFGNKVDDALLLSGKYVKLPDSPPAGINPEKYWITSGTQTLDAANFYQVIQIHDPFDNPPSFVEYDNAYHFYIQKVTDPIGNISEIGEIAINGVQRNAFNFRTLSPFVLKDINDNRTAARFDELGMPTSTFVMGKVGDNDGDVFDDASIEDSPNDDPTTKLEYTIDNWYKQVSNPLFDPANFQPNPNFVKVSAREKHHFKSNRQLETSVSKWQTSFSYSDGSGHEIMKKVPAEPGDVVFEDGSVQKNVNPRWVGNGRTYLNNKGKPIKQYEPFFSNTSGYEDSRDIVERGVTPIIHYDPLDRVIKTDFPDGTFSRVEFDAWKQVTYDQVDTVLDQAGGSFICQWYIDRNKPSATDSEPTDKEVRAAWLAAINADTPLTSYLDSLGRAFLSVQFNRTFKINDVSGKAVNVLDQMYETRIELDIENNQRSVIDAMGNAVMQYEYDMLSNKVKQVSMDAGTKYMLDDVAGKPFKSWTDNSDTAGSIISYVFSYEYDALHRPTKMSYNTIGVTEKCFEKIVYGENVFGGGNTDDKKFNLRGKPYRHYDTAGLVTSIGFDF
ncbi:MAG: toxin TcdB middle/C-terminal domain-containing protein, partial [Chitinophagales bacterium]